MPSWGIGWDVFCWIGQRRFSRHWSVPQIRNELRDSYDLKLSDDAIEDHIATYQNMVAARQQDPQELASVYRDSSELVLTIDGLQPEKAHETLYMVREVTRNRVLFAEPLLSGATDEIRKLIEEFQSFSEDKTLQAMAKVKASFQVGLFAGSDLTDYPHDNLDLERWFRLPKSHERRIHGHKHAGIRIVREGATLIPTLDAHAQHPGVFTEQDLVEFSTATTPASQLASQQPHGVMQKSRSKKTNRTPKTIGVANPQSQ